MESQKELSINHIFNDNSNDVEKMKSNLSKKVDLFLENNNYDTYVEILHSGYIPNEKQEKLFSNIIKRLIDEQNHTVLNSLIQKGYTFNNTDCYNYIDKHFLLNDHEHVAIAIDFHRDRSEMKNKILHTAEFFKTEEEIQNRTDVKEYYEKNFLKKAFNELINLADKTGFSAFHDRKDKEIQKLYVQLHVLSLYLNTSLQEFLYEKHLQAYKEATKFFFPHKVQLYPMVILYQFISDDFIKSKGMEHYLKQIALFKKEHRRLMKQNTYVAKHFLYFIDQMEQKLNVLFPHLSNDTLTETKLLYIKENAANLLHDQTIKTYQDISIESFPKRIADEINLIQSGYADIFKSNPNHRVIEEVQTIINFKLPAIINKYISMQPEYRLTMKNNQGKTAEDLLHESLQSIHSILKQKLQESQQDNLSDLSVENRILKKKTAK